MVGGWSRGGVATWRYQDFLKKGTNTPRGVDETRIATLGATKKSYNKA